MKRKKLTLIELIIVVMVLGLLVGLAIPQFTGVKANADVASFKNDIDVLTKAIDESYVKEDSLPLGDKVTVTDPALIDVIYSSGDSGENLFKVDLTKTEKYHSKLKTKVTSENYFIYSSETGKVFYTKGQIDGEGQVLYSLEYTGLSSAMLGSSPLKNGVSVPVTEPVQIITGTVPVDATVKVFVNGADTPVTVEDVVFDGNMDLMAAAKMKTFTSSVTFAEGKNVVAIKVNSAVTNFNVYLGARDSGGQPTPTPAPVIKPVAVISMTPEESLTTATNITWSYAGSTTEVGRTIIEAEWEGNQNVYTTIGSYTVRLRVKDSFGVWSDWAEKQINISGPRLMGEFLVVELIGITSNPNKTSVMLNEITVKDSNGNTLPITMQSVYDSAIYGTPYYWNDTIWNKTNLTDNDLSGTSTGSTGFLVNGGTQVASSDYARILIKFTNPTDRIKVHSITVNSHDLLKRGPRHINLYSVNSAIDLRLHVFTVEQTLAKFDNGTEIVEPFKINTYILE